MPNIIQRPVTRTRITSPWGQSVADWVNAYPGAWVVPTFQNGFVNYGSGYAGLACRLERDGIVRLRGIVTKAAQPVLGETIAIMPTGYRPTQTNIMLGYLENNTNIRGAGRYDVLADGRLNMSSTAATANSLYSFDGMTYYLG